MDKKSLVILLLVIIAPILLAFSYFTIKNSNYRKAEVCKDSDGGSDYFTKGYITYPTYNKNSSKENIVIEKWEDECLRKIDPGEPKPNKYYSTKSPEGKIEMYERVADCFGNNCYVKETVCTLEHAEYYQCPKGCKDGACIK